jgi:hypothetical protein
LGVRAVMANIEIGKPILEREFINVHSAKDCNYQCQLYRNRSTRFICYRYNGNLVIEVKGGITRDTISEVKKIAKCV